MNFIMVHAYQGRYEGEARAKLLFQVNDGKCVELVKVIDLTCAILFV